VLQPGAVARTHRQVVGRPTLQGWQLITSQLPRLSGDAGRCVLEQLAAEG